MRHGQTLFNLQHKIQGWCDAPLTQLGIKQAKIASEYFKDNQITFDAPDVKDFIKPETELIF